LNVYHTSAYDGLLLGRPTLSSANLALPRFYLSSSIFFSSSATLRARWTELNQNQPHARQRGRFENAYARNLGYPLPLQIEVNQNHLFRGVRNLTEPKKIYIMRQVHWELQGTSKFLHHLEMSWTLVHKRLKIGPSVLVLRTLRKCCIPRFVDGDQQTELNQTLPKGGQ